jgi:hypothetical protein
MIAIHYIGQSKIASKAILPTVLLALLARVPFFVYMIVYIMLFA